MDEITDQFRTEDAEEFKQLQAELEIAGLWRTRKTCSSIAVGILLAKNCRILQFKLRKAEKRNENMEAEKGTLEGTSHPRWNPFNQIPSSSSSFSRENPSINPW